MAYAELSTKKKRSNNRPIRVDLDIDRHIVTFDPGGVIEDFDLYRQAVDGCWYDRDTGANTAEADHAVVVIRRLRRAGYALEFCRELRALAKASGPEPTPPRAPSRALAPEPTPPSSAPKKKQKKKRGPHHIAAAKIAVELGETSPSAIGQIRSLVARKGQTIAHDLVADARRAHASGDGPARYRPDGKARSLGGVFFFLAKEAGLILGRPQVPKKQTQPQTQTTK